MRQIILHPFPLDLSKTPTFLAQPQLLVSKTPDLKMVALNVEQPADLYVISFAFLFD